MSLGVMNAKAISSRAGETARGFQPITDFIDAMARGITDQVNTISHLALELSKLAVRRHHLQKTLARFHTTYADETLLHRESIRPVINEMEKKSAKMQQQFINRMNTLYGLLDDIILQTRASQVISGTSRVEASQTLQYRSNLEVVADDLESAVNQIRQHVNNGRSQLREVISKTAQPRRIAI